MRPLQTTFTIDINNPDEISSLIDKLFIIRENAPVKDQIKEEDDSNSEDAAEIYYATKIEETTPEYTEIEEIPTKAPLDTNQLEDQIRCLVAEKGKSCKPMIKEKLTSLGASRLKDLKTELYQEFIDFLLGLK